MTLYLKYRPQKIEDLDLPLIRETLTNILKKDSLPHAFLFSGPKGTGKTSSARILAKAINCTHKKEGSIEPCNECEICKSITKGTLIDVIEMDAASNRGIDDVRALKQEIMLSPVQAKKKIYIIDEAHMLTTEASNALLKTLEEPPSHVVFILATTDPQKLPQTVVSRLARVNFTKATAEDIGRRLKFISDKEEFEVEEGVFDLIGRVSEGSFRDAVKFLEELSLKGKKITLDDAKLLVGSDDRSILLVLSELSKGNVSGVIEMCEKMYTEGKDAKSFLNSLIMKLHNELLGVTGLSKQDTNLNKENIVSLLELLLTAKQQMKESPHEFLPVEIAFANFSKDVEPKPILSEVKKNSENVVAAVKENIVEAVPAVVVPQVREAVLPSGKFDDILWSQILLNIRAKNAGVEALLRAAKPLGVEKNKVIVGLFFQFHKEKLESPAVKSLIDASVESVCGSPVKVEFCMTERAIKPIVETSLTQPTEPDIISAAKEIFGP